MAATSGADSRTRALVALLPASHRFSRWLNASSLNASSQTALRMPPVISAIADHLASFCAAGLVNHANPVKLISADESHVKSAVVRQQLSCATVRLGITQGPAPLPAQRQIGTGRSEGPSAAAPAAV